VEIFSGVTTQVLTGVSDSVVVAMDPVSDGEPILFPRVLSIRLPAEIINNTDPNIQVAVEGSADETLTYEFTSVPNGGVYTPNPGDIVLPSSGTGTFNVTYTAPSTVGIHGQTVKVINSQGNSVEVDFNTDVVNYLTADSGVDVLFAPVVVSLNGKRNGVVVTWTAEVSDDGPLGELTYLWGFTGSSGVDFIDPVVNPADFAGYDEAKTGVITLGVTDGDGFNDIDEKMFGSNPNKMDTDDDGVQDNVDSEPTVFDNFAPSYLNINGTSLIVNGHEFVFEEENLGDGVYTWVEEYDGAVFIIFKVYDDSGIKQVDIWTNGGFHDTYPYSNEQEVMFIAIYDFNFWWDKTIRVTVADANDDVTEEFSFPVAGTFSNWIRPIYDTSDNGINMFSDPVGTLWNWVGGQISFVKIAVEAWLLDNARDVMEFLNARMGSIVSSDFISSMSQAFSSVIRAMSNYQQGPLQNILDALIPDFGPELQPLINLYNQYELEILLAEEVLSLIISLSSPSGAASLAFSVLGNSGLSVGDFTIDLESLISSTVVTAMVDLMFS
ncbi:hypothetical protein LCGC14_2361170, partial [marine sediment metagenome]